MRARLGVGIAAATVALALVPGTAGANVIVVTTTADQYNSDLTACSLREAVQAANDDDPYGGCPTGDGADQIKLKGARYSLTRVGAEGNNTTGDLDIRADDLTITGPPARQATIDANGNTTQDRAIEVANFAPAIDVTIRNLTITDGGNIAVNTFGGGIAIHGIGNAHTLLLDGVTLVGNRAIVGGGLRADSDGKTVVRNSTISGNSANVSGAGIQALEELEVRSSTITKNIANADGDFIGEGGGIFNETDALTLKNTIVAGNTSRGPASGSADCDGFAQIDSLGFNLIGVTAGCPIDLQDSDRRNVPARLKPLAFNGGVTMTHALKGGSKALNNGRGCLAKDQRGAPRILGGRCDIGAYERIRCEGKLVNRVGTGGRDRLRGTGGKDGILGLGGKDILVGKGGKDGLCGGAGRDKLRGGPGDDKLDGGPAVDRCNGGGGTDALRRCP